MLPVSEAQQIVLEQARPLPPIRLPLGVEALGLVLAESASSDLDMPPYDKTLMDGYAVRSQDLPDGKGTLEVIEEVLAGHTPQRILGPGQATRIMTGAPIPDGADAVVVIERTQLEIGHQVRINDRPPVPWQNILPRAREMKAGEIILETGMRLTPQEFGLLAAAGRTDVQVHPAPLVTILATGDELVEPPAKPGPGQIRNSNGPMLLAQVCRAGGVPRVLGIARDNEENLKTKITEGLKADVLLLSGGVSAGKADLVPGVLQALGVQAHFHKVKMKPGKPVFFGSRGQSLVFGLPGNPVSSLVCFELFVRPALRRLRGQSQVFPPLLQARLAKEFSYRSDRPTYHPANIQWRQGQYEVKLLAWFGSADLRALTGANALGVIPEGEQQLAPGQNVDVLPLDYF